MVDKITFMETLRSVQDISETSRQPMSREEIQSYFQDMELSSEQQEMIYQYLQASQEESGGQGAAQGDAKDHRKSSVDNGKSQDGKKEHSDSAPFRMYLKEVSAVPVLGKEQKRELYESLLEGADFAIEELSKHWQRKIVALARNRCTTQVLQEDLVQEGNIGLLLGLRQLLGKAAEYGMGDGRDQLEEQWQQELEQKLLACILEGMQQYQRDLEGESDSQNTILAKVTLVYEASKVLAEENGTVPTLQELSEYTRIPQEEISDILALHEKAQLQ